MSSHFNNTTAFWSIYQQQHQQVYTPIIFGWITTILIATALPRRFLIWPFNLLSIRPAFDELFFPVRKCNRYSGHLQFLDVFRVIAFCWILCNHLGSEGRLDVLSQKSSANKFKHAIHSHPFFGPILGNSALGVEIFFCLSGFLAAKSWNSRSHQTSERRFLLTATKFLLRRWLRLAPVVAVYLCIVTSPLISRALPIFHSTMISTCTPRTFLLHLTLAGNWQEVPTCLGYLWHFGLDMQLYTLVPLLMYLLNENRPRTSFIVFTTLILGSMIVRAVQCYIYNVCDKSDVDIPFVSLLDASINELHAQTNSYNGVWEIYSRPLTNLGPFLIGLLAGQLITNVDNKFLTKNNNNERSEVMTNVFSPIIIKRSSAIICFFAMLAQIIAIYGILPQYWRTESDFIGSSSGIYDLIYTAIFRTLFSLGLASTLVVIFVHSIGEDLSSDRAKNTSNYALATCSTLARLTFSASLTHMPIVYLYNYSDGYQKLESVYGFLLAVFPAILLSFTVAFFFFCFFERPIINIVKQIIV